MGSGLPQRWQLRSPGGLATPHAGLAQRLGGPSGSAGPVSDCSMKPQSMQATAPSLRVEPHAGHLVGAADLAPLTTSPSEIEDIDPPMVAGAAPLIVAGAVAAGAGTRNGCLQVGHCTRLPAALSGTCICLPQAAFGHLMMAGIGLRG